MSELFPSVWQLLLPNFTIWTIIGAILLIIGILGLIGTIKLSLIGIKTPVKFSIISILAGVFMVWGISMFQKFVASQGGAVVFWGLIIVIVFGLVLFWQPTNNKNNNMKIKF